MNRRIEMYEYRQVLVRMRQGDTDRAIARSGLMGRAKAGEVRRAALAAGWLDVGRSLPEDGVLAERLRARSSRRSTTSSLEPFRAQVASWHAQGLQGTTIHGALVRTHGFSGSYSAVRRFLAELGRGEVRGATVILDFAPGEAAQVDFGKGPRIRDPELGEISTWVFVMTLCWSRHQYAEVVRDQTVETWLGCHRRAFESFGGVPKRLIIDNPKCAITRACTRDPEVQRAYGELAEGYGFRIDPCPPGDPQKKGRVEAGVKYVKRGFLPLRDFRSLADANRQLADWVAGEAGNRIHGTHRQRPLGCFVETERALLLPLPDRSPEPAAWAKVQVGRNGHVQHARAHYSVPFRLLGRREQKKFGLRLRRAGFRSTKTLECFDFAAAPGLNAALVHELATARFVAEPASVLIVGPCGTGKSHLAQALGHCAVRAGYDVLFTTQTQLLATLHTARATGTYERRFQALARVPLLVLDDFGLKPLRAPHDEDFHDLIAERYERTATLVTSNLDFPEWGDAFPNRLLGAATLDRLRDGAYRIVLDGDSHRKPRPLTESPNSSSTRATASPGHSPGTQPLETIGPLTSDLAINRKKR